MGKEFRMIQISNNKCDMKQSFKFEKIGVIHTPYVDTAPYQPIVDAAGEFRIILEPEYREGLSDLQTFRYIYVLYFIDRIVSRPVMIETPSWAKDTKVGLFASRSPKRPNPIGLSVVQLKKIVGNEIFTSGLDVFDNTPLLDIKPYIRKLDSKDDANYGWIENIPGNKEHLFLHVMGIPHDD